MSKKTHFISVDRNNYFDNPKNSSIWTPLEISYKLFSILKNKGYKHILDPSCGIGNLLKPWHDEHYFVTGVDINRNFLESMLMWDRSNIIEEDFLNIKEWQEALPVPDLVVCNPPFNGISKKEYKSRLAPEIFLKHLFKLFGKNIPIVMFIPMGFLFNQRKNSDRWKWLQENVKMTGLVPLQIDSFDDVLFHSGILFINIELDEPVFFI